MVVDEDSPFSYVNFRQFYLQLLNLWLGYNPKSRMKYRTVHTGFEIPGSAGPGELYVAHC